MQRQRNAKGQFIAKPKRIAKPYAPYVTQSHTRMDGFMSALTSVGTSRDIGTSVSYTSERTLSKSEIDCLYEENALFAKCIDKLPSDGLRKWLDYNHDDKEAIDKRVKELKLKSLIKRGKIKERKDGGAAIFMDVDDGQEAEMPLNLDNVKKIYSFELFDCDYVYPLLGDDARIAEYFTISGSALKIHRSRMIVFPGIEVSESHVINNRGWGARYSARLYKPVEAYTLTHQSVTGLAQTLVIDVWGINELNDMIDDDDDQPLKERFTANLAGQSLVNAVVIDSQDSYEKLVTNVTGVAELENSAERWLIAASGYPHTTLLGEGTSAGLSGEGGSENREYNETVQAWQEDEAREPIEQGLEVITAELDSETVSFQFEPLEVPTQLEMAEVHLKQAQADQKYFEMGVAVCSRDTKLTF